MRRTICDSGRLPPLGIKDPQLSQRERQILTRLAEGDSNKQIARAFNITESTVKVHLKAIVRKIHRAVSNAGGNLGNYQRIPRHNLHQYQAQPCRSRKRQW
jgi:DNA-binding CsgD family transcriptional regulator